MSIPTFGIDLGTTFCCLSYLGPDGLPRVVPDIDGQRTTPSVVHFTGQRASFGRAAARRKHEVGAPLYEFFKRDMGAGEAVAGRYKVAGFDFQAAGLQALLLRYLRAGAARHLMQEGLLGATEAEAARLPVVITVPAYFKDRARLETRLAGEAAGWQVVDIVDEPVAAALTYGLSGGSERVVLVFDLGGGTFDVTLIRLGSGRAQVLSKNGAQQLGGRDWDLVIEKFLFAEFAARFGREVPDELSWQVQERSVQAKLALSDAPHTEVVVEAGADRLTLTLYRDRASVPPGLDDQDDFDLSDDPDQPPVFVYEERCGQLLAKCQTLLEMLLEDAGKTWPEVDDLVLAGGSSRMPMIRKLLERVSRRRLPERPQLDYDTAISTGAALFSRQFGSVTNVLGHAIGIKVKRGGREALRHLLLKDAPLPARAELTLPAEADASLDVYEGVELDADAVFRGALALENPAGEVRVMLAVDAAGIISVQVSFGAETRAGTIKPGGVTLDPAELMRRIAAVELELPAA